LKGKSGEPHEEEIVFANVVLKNYPRKGIKKEVKDPNDEETEIQTDPPKEMEAEVRVKIEQEEEVDGANL